MQKKSERILLLAANRGDFLVEIRSLKRESNVVKIRHITGLIGGNIYL